MDLTLLAIAENVRGDEIRSKTNRWLQLIGARGSQTIIDILYQPRRRDEVALYRATAIEQGANVENLCIWGHECPPTRYCPRGRCSVCISSKWERILYALIQMTGLRVVKYYIERRELDMYIPELKRAIEYNGEQHYRAGLFTPDLAHRIFVDQQKLWACQRADIQLLFVRFDDPNPIETVLEFLRV